jgi:hypothetical protein
MLSVRRESFGLIGLVRQRGRKVERNRRDNADGSEES